MTTLEKANTLKALHEAPEILRVVNVWDAISTRTIADLPGTRAIATAGHSIAASHGFADGEIPLDVALAAVARIVQATDLPVTADLDESLGVARISYGPLTQRVALRALRGVAEDLYANGVIPEDTPPLN